MPEIKNYVQGTCRNRVRVQFIFGPLEDCDGHVICRFTAPPKARVTISCVLENDPDNSPSNFNDPPLLGLGSTWRGRGRLESVLIHPLSHVMSLVLDSNLLGSTSRHPLLPFLETPI